MPGNGNGYAYGLFRAVFFRKIIRPALKAGGPTNQHERTMQMTTDNLQNLAISAGILFAAYKFGPAVVKAGAIAVAAVIVAKNIPYVNSNL